MTGMERNSDVVVMTCYAPLLARVGYAQWNPDLIWFDESRVCRTPSYYVQQMFAKNLGDYNIELDTIDLRCYKRKKEAVFVRRVMISITKN